MNGGTTRAGTEPMTPRAPLHKRKGPRGNAMLVRRYGGVGMEIKKRHTSTHTSAAPLKFRANEHHERATGLDRPAGTKRRNSSGTTSAPETVCSPRIASLPGIISFPSIVSGGNYVWNSLSSTNSTPTTPTAKFVGI